jgi:hypothetical protein
MFKVKSKGALLITVALVAYIFFSQYANAKYEVFQMPQNSLSTDFPFTLDEGFADTNYGSKVWGLVLKFKDKAWNTKKMKLKGGDVFSTALGVTFVIGAENSMLLSEAGVVLYRIRWTPDLQGVQYDGCENKHLSLNPNNLVLKFPIGVSCNLRSFQPQVIISTIQSIEWYDYTLEEIEGKGERWKLFNLPSGNLNNTEIGKFVFKSKDKDKDKNKDVEQLIQLPLQISKLKFNDGADSITKTLYMDKIVGFEYESSSLTTPTAGYSSPHFAVVLKAETEKVYRNFNLGFASRIPFGLSQSMDTLVSQKTALSSTYLGQDADGVRKNYQWGLGLNYQAVNYYHKTSNFSVQASLIGVELKNKYVRGKHKYNLDLQMNNIGSNVFSAYNDIDFSYSRPTQLYGVLCRWGLNMRMSDIMVKGESGEANKISEMAFGGFLSL